MTIAVVTVASCDRGATVALVTDARKVDEPPGIVYPPAKDDFEQVVKPWMAALKSSDAKALVSLTSLPFIFATTGPVKTCEGKVTTHDETKSWLGCARKAQERIFSQLDAGADFIRRQGGWGESNEFKETADHISPAGTWVQAYLQVYSNGRRIPNIFRFLIVENEDHVARVGAFLMGVEK
jgi:hypothetical protein